jgi:hypothetical protein
MENNDQKKLTKDIYSLREEDECNVEEVAVNKIIKKE